jgi:hypothetical protein
MITNSRRAGLIGVLSIAALALAACGGGTSSAAPTDVAPTTAPTEAAGTTAPTEAAPSPSASSAIALPSFDLSDLVTNLDNVDSYRLTITTGGEVQYSGIVVTKPELARDVTMGDQRFVVIGDEVWMGAAGSDALTPAPAGMAEALLSTFDPVLLVGAFASPGAMAGAAEVGSEEKNGVSATHYRIDSGSLVGTLASMPPDSSIDVWIADDGYLVSLAVTGMAEGEFTLDVTDVNDPANVVERPE